MLGQVRCQHAGLFTVRVFGEALGVVEEVFGDRVIAERTKVLTTVVVMVLDNLWPLLGDVARLLLLSLADTLLRWEADRLRLLLLLRTLSQ